jgi:hypothetical protein
MLISRNAKEVIMKESRIKRMALTVLAAGSILSLTLAGSSQPGGPAHSMKNVFDAGPSVCVADQEVTLVREFGSDMAANKLRIVVRMIPPYVQQTELQIICVFKHNPDGDKYVASMKDFNDKLGGLLSSLRDRGEFVGDLGETLLFNVPAGTITPRRILVIGLGPEKDLSLETMRVVGRVALREAIRLKVKEVSFAPTIRDQGNSVLNVGDVDRVVVEEVILAYDTEKRLQAQGLADPFDMRVWLMEAGPAFVDEAIKKVKIGIEEANRRIKQRDTSPYRHKS